jgi:cytochrome c oxidase cbb3-type subunit 4
VVSSVEIEQLRIYGYIIGTGILTVILYSYIIYLYRSEKKGEKDYEKYGSLALDDELDSKILEENPNKNKSKKE